MSVPMLLLVASTAAAVLATSILLSATSRSTLTAPDPRTPPRALDPGLPARATASAVVVLLVVAVSGWIVPAMILGVASWLSVRGWQRRDRRGIGDVERTDALASWIENLRDVLLAGDQPIGAIAATVPTAPASIRPAVRRLSTSLGHQDPDTAFRRFADELDDPLGDLVAAGLLIAVHRGARTVAVLTALAEQARNQADRRRIVDAERAPLQREVFLLSGIMASLVIGLLVFGRADYLAPYDTGGGQFFLGVVLAVYAVLLLRVQRLARFPRPSRFLTSTSARSPSSEAIA
jgi:tight adherence protein B